MRVAFVHQGRQRHSPAVTHVPYPVRIGYLDVCEKYFVEFRLPVICRKGWTSTPGLFMSTAKYVMPVFGHVGISSSCNIPQSLDAPSCSKLLTVDNPRLAISMAGFANRQSRFQRLVR